MSPIKFAGYALAAAGAGLVAWHRSLTEKERSEADEAAAAWGRTLVEHARDRITVDRARLGDLPTRSN